jgi:glycosyltransferase involved in cell wall biosynthesis
LSPERDRLVPELTYLSTRPLAMTQAPVLISVVRNEALRLPYFLAHYRRLGLEQLIFVDNGSTDGSREFLLAQPDTFVFETHDSFAASRWGMAWVHAILDAYCDGRWVVLADADELLVWPGSEQETIPGLIFRLEASGADALFALLLDMYSDKPFGSIGYVPGTPFTDACPLFDTGPYSIYEAKAFPFRQIYGGVRARLFRNLGVGFSPPTVSKVPLVRWRKGQRFILVAHALAQPMRLASMRAALLHFKMFDDLPEKCRIETERQEHYEQGREYRALAAAIANSPDGTFFDAERSARFQSTGQLVDLGLMSASGPFELKSGTIGAGGR